jgi:hypothetical protein
MVWVAVFHRNMLLASLGGSCNGGGGGSSME